MRARRKEQFPGRGGFTISEMLAAVGVLVLLLALSMPPLAKLRREIRQKELDNKAQILLCAAQNRLSKLRAAHREEDYALLPERENGVEALGYTPEGSDGEAGELCFVASFSQGSAAAALLPPDGADGQLPGHHWLVEYSPGRGSVYGVFYSEEAVDWESEEGRRELDRLRRREERLSDGAKVGYCGKGREEEENGTA